MFVCGYRWQAINRDVGGRCGSFEGVGGRGFGGLKGVRRVGGVESVGRVGRVEIEIVNKFGSKFAIA